MDPADREILRLVKKAALLIATTLALLAAGGAGAYAVAKTVSLAPGHCKTIHGTKVCAKNARPKTVIVSPSPIGKAFSGAGDETLAPLTIPKNGDIVHWTSQPYNDGVGDISNQFSVFCGAQDFDNGSDGATSGSSFVPAGTYTCQIIANDGGWTVSF
jgi:hypothetical protein